MFVDAATGAVSDVRTTAVCSCGGTLQRYAMAEGVASEPVRGLVPYEDGCVTPTQPYSITQVSTELTVMLTKTTTAPASEARTLLLKLVGRHAGATRALGGGERTHTVAP